MCSRGVCDSNPICIVRILQLHIENLRLSQKSKFQENMEAVVFCSNSVLLPSFFSFSKQPKLGNFTLSMKEIADVPSAFSSRKDLLQLTVSSMRSDGSSRGRPPRKSPDSGRTTEGNDNKIPQSSDGNNTNSSNQKEIIALFRRIQSSISKGDSPSTKKNNSNLSEAKPSVEPVLEIIGRSGRQVKADTASNKEGDKVFSRRGVPKKEQELQGNTPITEFKITRPPSNFVKRSPIPSPSTPRGKILKPNVEASANAASTEELKSSRVEKLKLPELKELAKARGIKGYSRLKKSELVELLRS